MPSELAPPELASLVDFAERSRVGDWSLRSALVRYAQSQPMRVSQVLELVRRIDAGLHPFGKVLARRGPQVWQALAADLTPGADGDALLVGLLRAATELDALADQLAAWAVDRSSGAPDAAVDRAVATVARQLDVLGVERETRPGPPGRRG